MLSFRVARNSWAHNMPAGRKLAVLCILSILLFPLIQIWVQIFAFLIVLGCYLSLGRNFLMQGLLALRPLWIFCVFIAVYNFWTQDFTHGFVITLRMLTLVALANFVTMTTKIEEIIELVKKVLSPLNKLGVPVGAIGLAIAMVMRFTPALRTKANNLIEAWRARSSKRAKTALVLPILIAGLDDAQDVSEALRARGGVPK